MRIKNDSRAYGLLAGLIVLLLGLIVADAGCTPMHAERGPQAALEQAVKITATCFGDDGSITGFYGSGVIVDSKTVITAAHVARDPDGYTCFRVVEMTNEHKYIVTPGVILVERDIATLKLDSSESFDPTYPVIYGPSPGFGERVCAMVAHPMWLWRCGDAQMSVAPPGDRIITITVEPGNSGSGVYDAQGRLVGIITHRWSCGVTGQLCGGKMSTLEGYVGQLRP